MSRMVLIVFAVVVLGALGALPPLGLPVGRPCRSLSTMTCLLRPMRWQQPLPLPCPRLLLCQL